jgi:phosphomannomutase
VSKSLKEKCSAEKEWTLDEDNLEGVRVRLSSGGFFMIRQSLHDPVISLQVESVTEEYARSVAVSPLFELFSERHQVLDLSAIER